MRGTRRPWLAVAVVSVIAISCSSSAVTPSPTASSSPAEEAAAPIQVWVELSPTASGSCCRVETVNVGGDLTVGCFIVVFDAADRYVTTVLLPPKPPGHTRSSGFTAAAGREDQGAFEIPLDLATGSYRTTCRPAAWHGGAPI